VLKNAGEENDPLTGSTIYSPKTQYSLMLPENPEFVRYHKRLLGKEFPDFIKSLGSRKRTYGIRANTLKKSVGEVEETLKKLRLVYSRIPWCGEGFWVDGSPDDTMEHKLGHYYIQSPMSQAAAKALDPKPGEKILDLCAAPGGKTTHIAQLMENTGILVANDRYYRRLRGLVHNIQRCGVSNTAVTLSDGCRFKPPLLFDRVLVDAPCSSVGTARKNPDVVRRWSMKSVLGLSVVQKKLILSAYDSLKPGGVLVYSTCTTPVEENEEVLEHLLGERGAKIVPVKLEGLEATQGLTNNTRACLRAYPHKSDDDALFLAKIRKEDG